MKQFNLEEYLANPSKKVVTRDGRSVRIRCTDKKGTIYPVVALVDMGSREIALHYTRKGENWISKESDRDLFFIPEKHEGWINVYRNRDTGTVGFGAKLYTSREEAEKSGKTSSNYVATAKMEWEE